MSSTTTSTVPLVTSLLILDTLANSRSLPIITWPHTPPKSPARLSMAASPVLPALGLGLSSSGGPSLGFVPPVIICSLRLASSRPSTRPRISMRLQFVTGIDRLCNLSSIFIGASGYFFTGLCSNSMGVEGILRESDDVLVACIIRNFKGKRLLFISCLCHNTSGLMNFFFLQVGVLEYSPNLYVFPKSHYEKRCPQKYIPPKKRKREKEKNGNKPSASFIS